jgi:hypothetical protein
LVKTPAFVKVVCARRNLRTNAFRAKCNIELQCTDWGEAGSPECCTRDPALMETDRANALLLEGGEDDSSPGGRGEGEGDVEGAIAGTDAFSVCTSLWVTTGSIGAAVGPGSAPRTNSTLTSDRVCGVGVRAPP